MKSNKGRLNSLTAISPIDGRYWEKTSSLSGYLSEYALIKTRFEVEIEYLLFLADEKMTPKLSGANKKILRYHVKNFTLTDATRVKEIENEINHDLKAVEYFIREKLEELSLEKHIPYVHLFLTSDDINNVAYRLMVKRAMKDVISPSLNDLTKRLKKLSNKYKDSPILARTHGQPAVPTTFGKETAVFLKRLNIQTKTLKSLKLRAKLNGAVGNWNAHRIVNSRKDWISLSEKFIKSLGLDFEEVSTQTAPPEDLVEIFQTLQRINLILLDFDKDMWRYISGGWLIKKQDEKHVGSSTMPQKVNPINFENSEGNIEIANSYFETLARELPVSRLQRDLSDSTLLRNIGPAFAHSLLAYKSTIKGLDSISLNEEKTKDALNENWTILAEAAQTILRNSGKTDAYERVAKKTKGKKLDEKSWKKLVRSLDINKNDKKKLLNLTPESYLGFAQKIAEET